MQYNLDHINLLEKIIKNHFFAFSDEVQKRAIKTLLRMRAAGMNEPSTIDEISIVSGNDDDNELNKSKTKKYTFENYRVNENGEGKKVQIMTLETPEGERIVVTPTGIEECQVSIRNIYPVIREEKERKEVNALIRKQKEKLNQFMNRLLDIIPANIKENEILQLSDNIDEVCREIDKLSECYIEHIKRLHYDTSLTITDILIPHGISNFSIPGFKKLEGRDYLVREIKEVDPKEVIPQDEIIYEIEDYYNINYDKTLFEKDFIPLDMLFYKNEDLKKALKLYKARHGYDFTPANHYMPPREKNHKK